MKVPHIDHGEVTADVTVEDKESTRLTSENLISKMIQASRSPESCVFLKIPGKNEIFIYTYGVILTQRHNSTMFNKTAGNYPAQVCKTTPHPHSIYYKERIRIIQIWR